MIKLKTASYLLTIVLATAFNFACADVPSKNSATNHQTPKRIIPGADQTQLYVNYLKGKNVALTVNHTSVIGPRLVPSADSLISLGVMIKKIFGPEHGFRGNASAGAKIKDEVDAKTGVPVISLYGKSHKPSAESLKGIDVMVFDIQDVGARFYTYISTMHYVMEACAENNVEVLILDRPNPNGNIVDGPMLDTAYRSFVGMHPIPLSHGMTIGEYAQMINGEGWLKNKIKCKLKVIKVANYKRTLSYVLPISPSPNLNTNQSILLYPSICLFEGTPLSLGRGTMLPFVQVGHPALKGKYQYSFTPVSIAGMSEEPPLKNQVCYGINLKDFDTADMVKKGQIKLTWVLEMYKAFADKTNFFNKFFDTLAGTDVLRKQIIEGKTEAEIRQTWQAGLTKFKSMRAKYLLY